MLLGDHSGYRPYEINPVATAFGITTGVWTIEPFDLYFTSFANRPIFNDCAELYYRAAGELSVVSPAELVAFTDNGEGVVAVAPHHGKVIAVGDINVWDNNRISRSDNQAFAVNVFEAAAAGHILTVQSDHGAPVPDGKLITVPDISLACSVNSPAGSSSVRHLCTGWSMTGNAPATGSGNSFSSVFTNDASLTWEWDTEYYLNTVTSGSGTVVPGDGWHDAGAVVPIAAVPGNGYAFVGWSGPAVDDGWVADPASASTTVAMNGPCYLMANFMPQPAFDPLDYSRRMTVTFSGYRRTETLTNFPVLLRLSEQLAGFDYSDFSSSAGGDLRIADHTRTNLIHAYEIEEWNTGGESLVWVRVPELTSNATIYAYWGNPLASVPHALHAPQDVWSESFAGVWHLSEGSGAHADSTPHGSHSAGVSVSDQDAGGTVDGADLFVDTANDYITVSADGNVLENVQETPYTFSTWYKPLSVPKTGDPYNAFHGLVMRSGAHLGLTYGVGQAFYMTHWDSGGNHPSAASAGGSAPINIFYHVAGVVDHGAGTVKLYVDGQHAATAGFDGTTREYGTASLKLGTANPWTSVYRYPAHGVLDEVRVSDAARGSNWIWACWANQSTGSAFLVTEITDEVGLLDATALGAYSVGETSAVLNGRVDRVGSAEPAATYVCWGVQDGGAGTTGAWANVTGVGPRDAGESVTLSLSTLRPGGVYAFRVYITNSVGEAWSDPATFATDFSGDGFTHRLDLDTSGYTRPTVLTNFPLLVRLNEDLPGFDYSLFASAQGRDLRFTDGTRTNLIWAWEVERWDTNGESLVWVRVSRLSSNSTLCAYWGNPDALLAPPSHDPGAVWSERFAAVWHLHEAGGTHTDSTAYANHSASVSVSARNAGGMVDGADLFVDTENDYITVSTDGTALENVQEAPYTFSAWYKPLSLPKTEDPYNAFHGLVMRTGAHLGLTYARTRKFLMTHWESDGGYQSAASATDSAPTNRLYHVAGVVDHAAGTVRLYLNGEQAATAGFDGTTREYGSGSLKLGCANPWSSVYRYSAHGVLDEVRVSDTARGPDWIWACWASQSTGQTFLSSEVVADPSLLQATALGAADLTPVSAVLSGRVDRVGSAASAAVYVCWGTRDGGTGELTDWTRTAHVGELDEGEIAALPVSGLSPGSVYAFRLFITNSAGRAWSDLRTLATPLAAGPLSVAVVESQSFDPGHVQDEKWRSVAAGMGYASAVHPQSILDSTNFFGSSDVLIVSSALIELSSNRQANVQAFIEQGGSAYIQSERLSTDHGNVLFESAVSALGGGFAWSATVDGSLSPMHVQGAMAAKPCAVSSLSVFESGCAGGGTGVESFLQYGNDHFGFVFAPESGGQGMIATTSDQGWAMGSGTESELLMQNILDRLAGWATPFSARQYAGGLKVTFSGYERSQPLTNFPVLIRLGPAIGGFDYDAFSSPDAGDLRFTDATRTNLLQAYEIERWDTNGESLVWVRVPELTSDTTIYAYWGNALAVTPHADHAPEDVWSEDFAGVWHLAESSGTHTDSTAYANHSAGVSVSDQDADAMVDGGDLLVDIANDYVTVSTDGNMLENFQEAPYTMSVWYKPLSVPRSEDPYNYTHGLVIRSGAHLGLRYYSSERFAMVHWQESGYAEARPAAGAQPTNRFYHVAAAVDHGAGTIGLYVDGELVDTGTFDGTTYEYGTGSLKLGSANPWGSVYAHPAHGVLDEVRISGAARGSNWIWACWANQRAGQTFYSTEVIDDPSLLQATALGAGEVTQTSAVLSGRVDRVGSMEPAQTFVCWGARDGGTGGTGAWEHVAHAGTRDEGQAVAMPVSGLTAGGVYAFRLYITNSAGWAWSDLRTFSAAFSGAPYARRLELALSGYSRGETLINFPLLVRLSTAVPGFDYSAFTSPEGADLRFTDATRTNVLHDVEVERWDTNGESLVWVRAPLVTSNTTLYAHWGHPDGHLPDPQQDAAAVWAEGFAGVWHMAERSGTHTDSTEHAGHSYSASVSDQNAAGMVDGGDLFLDTANDYVTVSTSESVLENVQESPYTFSVWYKPLSLPKSETPYNSFHGLIIRSGNHLGLTYGQGRKFLMTHWQADSTYNTAASATDSAPTNQFHHAAGVVDHGAGTIKLFLNGEHTATVPFDGTTWEYGVGSLKLGSANPWGTMYRYSAHGILDEVRVSSVPRGSNWIWACWMNQKADQGIVRYGSIVSNLASFAIVATSSGQGEIVPAGTNTCAYGSNMVFSIAPAAHWHVGDVTVDSVSIGATNGYTFENVMDGHTIHADFDVDLSAGMMILMH